jgi:hypothetical protein
MTIRYLVFRYSLAHNLAVISNGSSGAPEKNGNDVTCTWWQPIQPAR